jgi:hypothetical protein
MRSEAFLAPLIPGPESSSPACEGQAGLLTGLAGRIVSERSRCTVKSIPSIFGSGKSLSFRLKAPR